MANENLPGLGTTDAKVSYFGIKDGRITYRPGKGQEPILYNYIEGKLSHIDAHETDYNGAHLKFYDFNFENSGNKYKLSVLQDSSVARSIILSLMSIVNISAKTVRIAPWKKGDFTNISVYANGEKAGWIVSPENLPKPKDVMVSGKKMKDTGDLIAFVDKYVQPLNERLKLDINPETGEVEQPEVDFEPEPAYLSNGNDFPEGNLG